MGALLSGPGLKLGMAQSRKSLSRPQVGRHFRLEALSPERRQSYYQRWKWLKRYRAFKRRQLWKTTRNK